MQKVIEAVSYLPASLSTTWTHTLQTHDLIVLSAAVSPVL